MDRRLLTPAEAVLLLAPSAGSGSKCVEAGLLSLVDAGRVEVERAANPFRQAALLLLPDPPEGSGPLASHLEALATALRPSGRGRRMVKNEVIHALQRRFGYGYGGYVHDEVAPGLIKRDLLTRTDSKWLGLFRRTRYQRTARGEALVAPLARLMKAIEALPALIDADPAQAIRLARSAGVLLIMSRKARRQIPQLRKLLAARGDDLAPLTYIPLASEREDEWEQVLQVGDMALAFDGDSLFDGIDAVGDLTSGGDSASSDGGGDGDGGDGGGGD